MKLLACLLVCLLVAAPGVAAQDPPPSPEDMMAVFLQYADPDQHHERLATTVGTWHIEGQMRMGPDAPWQPTSSTAEVEAILGGRFFVQRVSGPAMVPGGPAFEGYGVTGYDRIQEKYTATWADNHGTMMMTGTGTPDASGNVITTDLTYSNPVTKQPAKARWVTRYVDDDHMVFEMYEHTGGDNYFLAGELHYRRVTPSPVTTSLQRLNDITTNFIMQTAEMLTEEHYAYRPTDDVRTAGQILAHIANAQFAFCASAAGDPMPTENYEETATTKAAILDALGNGFAYCNEVYAAMTDGSGATMRNFFGNEMAASAILAFNSAHNYEHYGNLVTYMRINGLTPPSSMPQP